MRDSQSLMGKLYLYLVLPLISVLLLSACYQVSTQVFSNDTMLTLLLTVATLMAQLLLVKQAVIWRQQLKKKA